MTFTNLPTSFSLEETFSFLCILPCSPSLCREDCEGEEGEEGEEGGEGGGGGGGRRVKKESEEQFFSLSHFQRPNK